MGDGRVYGRLDATRRDALWPQMNRRRRLASCSCHACQLAPWSVRPSVGQFAVLEMHLALFLVKWPFRFQRCDPAMVNEGTALQTEGGKEGVRLMQRSGFMIAQRRRSIHPSIHLPRAASVASARRILERNLCPKRRKKKSVDFGLR